MRSIRYRPTVQIDRSVRQDHVPGNLALKPRIVANIDLRDLLINKGRRAITFISSFNMHPKVQPAALYCSLVTWTTLG